MGPAWIRDRTRVSCTSRQVLYRWVTREALGAVVTKWFTHSILETLTASRGARGGLCVCVCVCVANAVEKTVFGRADLCQGEDLIYFTVIILTLSLLDPGGYYARISLVRI